MSKTAVSYDLPREEIAGDCLVQISIKKFSPRRALKELGIYEKALEYPSVFALVTETNRYQYTIKRVINHVLLEKVDSSRSKNKSFKKFPLFVQQLLLIGTYRTIFENPKQPFPLVTSCIIEIIKRRNFSRLIKNIDNFFHLLENFDFKLWIENFKDKQEMIAIETSNPLWLVRSLMTTNGYDEVKEILNYSNQQPPIYIRINTLKDSSVVFQEFQEKKIDYFQDSNFNQIYKIIYKGKDRLPNLKTFKEGHFFIQSRTSAYVPLIINPKPEHKILDTCASPGGKTTFLASLMNNKGKISAYEINKERYDELNRNLIKYDVRNVDSYHADIRQVTLSEVFDIVMIDAPCSGTGTIATRPYIKWQLSKQKIKNYSLLQKEILESISNSVKPETGLIYYVTCSLLPEENEEVIKEFLGKNGDFFKPISLNFDFGKDLPFLGKRLLPNTMKSEGFSMFCLKRIK